MRGSAAVRSTPSTGPRAARRRRRAPRSSLICFGTSSSRSRIAAAGDGSRSSRRQRRSGRGRRRPARRTREPERRSPRGSSRSTSESGRRDSRRTSVPARAGAAGRSAGARELGTRFEQAVESARDAARSASVPALPGRAPPGRHGRKGRTPSRQLDRLVRGSAATACSLMTKCTQDGEHDRLAPSRGSLDGGRHSSSGLRPRGQLLRRPKTPRTRR